MSRLLIATHNPGKIVEIAALLADLPVECLNLAEAGVTDDVAETGSTLAENAILKARAYAGLTGLLTVADDSGLEVDALGGRPGVHTKRYGGPELTPVQRYHFLLDNLRQVPWPQRGARFRCVMALADPARLWGTAEGVCEGLIAFEPAGQGGFGYDPVFYLSAYGQTMAQLPAGVKNTISHRAHALQALSPLLRDALTRS